MPSPLRGADDESVLSDGEQQRSGDSESCSVPQPMRYPVHRSAWRANHRRFLRYDLAARCPLSRPLLSATSSIRRLFAFADAVVGVT